MIATARLDLINATTEALQADLESPAALSRALGVRVTSSWPPELYDADATRWVLNWMAQNPDDHRWGFYYMTLRDADGTRTLIGTCGYTGSPDSAGVVELGYGVVSEYRRRGYATEATLGLVRMAFEDPRVQQVIAHTLPHLTPSIGVLERAGFVFVGQGDNPTEPTAIRFALSRQLTR